MTQTDCDSTTQTHCACADRAGEAELQSTRRQVLENDLAMTLFDSTPDMAMILNRERQIVAVNQRVAESLGAESARELLGLRSGETVGCVNVELAPSGCGTGHACQECGALDATVECLERGQPAASECRIRTTREVDGGALDINVIATPIRVGEEELVSLSLRDISAEKRRDVLERVFFHDVLNITMGLQAVSELLTSEENDPHMEEKCKQNLRRISQQLHEEVLAQRQLLAAEQCTLVLDVSSVSARDIMESTAELYRSHSVAKDRTLAVGEAPDCEILTDATLLRRVLGNLAKNALEATEAGGTVAMDATDAGDHVEFHVRNAVVIPEDIQEQIFQRSFSTKSGSGRGIGTHSAKLLTERYLQGAASFTSQAPEGTVFSVTVPKELSSGEGGDNSDRAI